MSNLNDFYNNNSNGNNNNTNNTDSINDFYNTSPNQELEIEDTSNIFLKLESDHITPQSSQVSSWLTHS